MTPATDAATRAREIAIKHALSGIYDGISTHATRRGDADGRPYMVALREALTEAASQPREGEVAREIQRMRECANDWRRPALAQIEGPSDLKIYGGTIADDIDRWADMLSLTQRPPEQAGAGNARDRAIAAMRAYVESAGVPISELDPEFVVSMMAAMMVSFHKYGRVADAYPLKFDAASDVRARMKKYRETGNRHYLVDAANFAMIEAMHPSRASEWAGNDAADSPGRTTASGHRLVQEDNVGNRIIGETILHVPGDEA